MIHTSECQIGASREANVYKVKRDYREENDLREWSRSIQGGQNIGLVVVADERRRTGTYKRSRAVAKHKFVIIY